MRVWRWLTAAGVWLLAVAVVAAVAWFAIDSAGHEVGADGAVGLVAASAPASGGIPSATTATGRQPASTPGGAAASPSPTLATTARDVAPGTPSSGAAPSRSTTRAPSSSAAPRPTPSPPGQGTGRTGIFSGTGGDIVVRCVGAKVDAWVLRPADGWREEPVPGNHGDVEVVFTPTEGQALVVYVLCRDGNPVFVPGGRAPRR